MKIKPPHGGGLVLIVRDKGKGKREEGKPIYIFLTGNPLVPHPSSLNLNISLGEADITHHSSLRLRRPKPENFLIFDTLF